jgi:hypothetical protein
MDSLRPPFAMFVEAVFSLKNRGTVATGQIIHGTVRAGDSGFLVREHGFSKPVQVTQIEVFKKTLDEASAGLHVSLQLRGVEKSEVRPGDLVQSAPTERMIDPNVPQCNALDCHCSVKASSVFCDWHEGRNLKGEAFPLKDRSRANIGTQEASNGQSVEEDVNRKAESEFYASIAEGAIAQAQSPKKTVSAETPAQTYFAGKTEVIWLVVIGIVSLAAFIASLIEAFPSAVVVAAGALACVFALPLVLIVTAVILAAIVQIFTPGGGGAIPLFGWKGGVDGLSLVQRHEFEAKPRMLRFAKVHLWLAVNSLVGALITAVAFAAIYTLMQFAQRPNH